MAKSLFASLLLQKPKKAVNFEAQNYSFKTEDCFNLYKPGNMCGHFHDLHTAFCSQSHCKIDIGLHMLQPRMPVYRHKLCTSFFFFPPLCLKNCVCYIMVLLSLFGIWRSLLLIHFLTYANDGAVPFKFDSQSPDDSVLSGIIPSRLRPKGTLYMLLIQLSCILFP